jgi:hypothetical protein
VADDQASAAPVATTSPLSSPAPSPSPSPSPAAPVAVSTPTPASPAGTTPTPTPAERPDWLPSADEFWDPEKKEVRGADLGKKFNELATWKAAEDVRKGSLPQTAESYKVELPADFKPPAGIEYKIDAADPAIGQFKQWLHKYGVPQDGGNELFGIFAGREVGTEGRIKAAAAAEVSSLGATGPARVDAVLRWFDGMGVSDLKSGLITAKHVQAFEKLITQNTSQGSASFTQSHRVPPDTAKIPGYEGMSFEQRRQAQDQLRARRTG